MYFFNEKIALIVTSLTEMKKTLHQKHKISSMKNLKKAESCYLFFLYFNIKKGGLTAAGP